MDRDPTRPLPHGAACTACGATVPAAGVRILAHRDDVAFVELQCPACGSTTLALLIGPVGADGGSVLDVADEARSGSDGGPRYASRPITDADVEAIRNDLATWHGDLVGWLDALDRGRTRGSVVDR